MYLAQCRYVQTSDTGTTSCNERKIGQRISGTSQFSVPFRVITVTVQRQSKLCFAKHSVWISVDNQVVLSLEYSLEYWNSVGDYNLYHDIFID